MPLVEKVLEREILNVGIQMGDALMMTCVTKIFLMQEMVLLQNLTTQRIVTTLLAKKVNTQIELETKVWSGHFLFVWRTFQEKKQIYRLGLFATSTHIKKNKRRKS